MSWVAITTDVPSLFSSMKRRSSLFASGGSTLPVGSSASRISGCPIRAAGDRRALLLAAGEDRRQRLDAVAEADPFQKLDHVGAVARLVAAEHAQRQRDILEGREMVEQAEILEHDADAASQCRQFRPRQCRDIAVEDLG